MSYDLMVFKQDAAPHRKKAFMDWYENQTQWQEDHGYNDPANTCPELRNWYKEMQEYFPNLNGSHASEDHGNPRETDFCIGREVIYAAFSWSQAGPAYQKTIVLAGKHNVGFFDASRSEDIWVPVGDGRLQLLKEGAVGQRPWWKFW